MPKKPAKYLVDTEPLLFNYLDEGSLNYNIVSLGWKSNRKVPLICPYCGMNYSKSAYLITTHGIVCRRCKSLATKYPELLNDWDYNKNTVNPYDILPGADKKVHWKCSFCAGSWVTTPHHRALRGQGCPYCSGRRLLKKEDSLAYRYPHLTFEWNYSKNNGTVPWELTKSSGFKAAWICNVCSHEWESCVYTRIKGHRCPGCAGQVATEKNNITKTLPHLIKEFSNKNKLKPQQLTKHSNKRVMWECQICEYVWCSTVYNRAKGHGCPNCAGQVVNKFNNLLVMFPEIVKDWDYRYNKKRPEEYTSKTNKTVWWVCHKCNYRWKMPISERTRSDRVCGRCPGCNNGQVSYISQNWLDDLNIPAVKGINREVSIFCAGQKFIVDGFNPNTNTIYEFLGDFWHGNPEIFSAEDINPVNKKRYSSLYGKWLNRKSKLERYGYKVVFVWENDYNNTIKEQTKTSRKVNS